MVQPRSLYEIRTIINRRVGSLLGVSRTSGEAVRKRVFAACFCRSSAGNKRKLMLATRVSTVVPRGSRLAARRSGSCSLENRISRRGLRLTLEDYVLIVAIRRFSDAVITAREFCFLLHYFKMESFFQKFMLI